MWNGLRRSSINKISEKRRAESKDYRALVAKLLGLCSNLSELSGQPGDWRGLQAHHIEGRAGKRYLDPCNLILVNASEHEEIHKHNTYQKKQELLALIKPIREKQGF